MSKNLTRKGLAFGAVVALGTTLFAGAPAQAASVLFAPTTGTGNTLVAGETFSLTASLSSDLPSANSTQLKFKVANTTGVAATVTINNKTIIAAGSYTAVHGAGYAPVALDVSVGGTTAGSALAAGTASAVYGVTDTVVAEWTSDTQTVAGVASTATNPTTIKIASTAATTANYTVTAWLDANNNGVVDSGELSADQTVKFVKIADSGVAVSFTKPTLADANNVATIGFAADVNVAQLSTSKFALAFGTYGSSGKVPGTAATVFTSSLIAGEGVSYDSTNKVLKLTAAAVAAPVFAAGETRSAQAIYNNAGVSTVATNALVGTEVTQTVGAAEITEISALAPVISDNAVLSSGTTFNIRSGVTSTNLVATVKKNTSSTDTTKIAVAAGIQVKVTVSSLVLGTAVGATAADTMTVNGVAVTSSTVSTYSTLATTDAAGKVSIPVVTSAGTATDSITVTITPVNGAASLAVSATATWAAPTLNAVADLIVGSNTPVHTAVKGGAYSAQYVLTDSYNALVKTAGTYRLVFTAPGAGTSPTSQTVYADFVDGIATVSLTDNSTGAGTNAATYTVQKKTDGLWAPAASPNNTTVNAPFTVTATAPVASAVSALESTTNTALEILSTFATVDQRTAYNTATAPSGFTASSINTITGQVTDAQGVGIAGAKVTVAATGIQFKAGNVYSVGTITVVANSVGTYTVDAYSHKSGKVTYTVTSGAATKTVDVTYKAPLATAGTSLVITAPGYSLPGRTLKVTAALTDKFGNAVDTKQDLNNDGDFADAGESVAGFSVTYSGAGLVVGSLATESDATGSASVSALLGAADSGNVVVTVSYDQNNDGDYADTLDLVKSATIVIGAAPVAAPAYTVAASGSTGKFFVSATGAANKTVVVKVGGKFVKSFKPATADKKVVAIAATKGSKAVTVFVGGKLALTKTVTVK